MAAPRALHKTAKKAEKNKGSRARARIVVETKNFWPITYQRELVKCGKPKCSRCRRGPAHGPYWYAYWRSLTNGGRLVSRYIGKNFKRGLEEWS